MVGQIIHTSLSLVSNLDQETRVYSCNIHGVPVIPVRCCATAVKFIMIFFSLPHQLHLSAGCTVPLQHINQPSFPSTPHVIFVGQQFITIAVK